jgi:hypothetical protein
VYVVLLETVTGLTGAAVTGAMFKGTLELESGTTLLIVPPFAGLVVLAAGAFATVGIVDGIVEGIVDGIVDGENSEGGGAFGAAANPRDE